MAEVAVRPKPISLSDAEIDTADDPIVKASSPVPVRAWARYSEAVVRVRGEAIEWNSKAVHIQWTGSDGEKRDAWVWASAVARP